MAEIKRYSPGEFCWTELATKDAAAAKKFYQSLFGWKTKDIPIGEGMTYTMFQVDGKDACAMFEIEKAEQKTVPVHWGAYISVANADDAFKKAKTNGAKVVQEPMDVMDVGRMAVLQDPTGAHFSVWQPKKHIGATVNDMPGTVCWRELITPNVDLAGKFYSTLFGWKGSAKKMDNMTYHMFELGKENMVAGMLLPPMKNIPPHWLTYFVVEDCKKTVSKCKSAGGEVMKDTTPIPDMGEFAVLGDPQGGAFGVMQFEE